MEAAIPHHDAVAQGSGLPSGASASQQVLDRALARQPQPLPGDLMLRQLGLQAYLPTWDAMRAFTAARTPTTPDEIWLVEHLPVYTLGQAGKPEHVLTPGDVPVVQTDRGGQVTYHGRAKPWSM
jgi:Lipoate-protein ligase B